MDLHLRGKRVLSPAPPKALARPRPKPLPKKVRRHAGRPQRRAAKGPDRAAALGTPIGATAHVVDLRKGEDIARLAKEAADIDILVNNAGDIPGGSIDKIDEATWRHAWELKVFGYINLTRAIYAQMKARGTASSSTTSARPAKSSTPTTSAAAPATPR